MTRGKILCVDDDAYLTDLLRYALSREGYTVGVAHTGADALQSVRTEPPHLILLDGNLPDADGFELCQHLRALLHVPIIMLTARGADEAVLTGLGSGADDYVGKPFNMQILVYRVRAVLRRVYSGAPVAVAAAPATYEVGSGSYDSDHNETGGAAGAAEADADGGPDSASVADARGAGVLGAADAGAGVGHNTESDVSVIKTHIRHLRMKLAEAVDGAEVVCTVPGVGYTARLGALPLSQGMTG